jgi:hypothetical protein
MLGPMVNTNSACLLVGSYFRHTEGSRASINDKTTWKSEFWCG